MSLFEKFIYSLQSTMKTPEPYGWFHLLCIAIVIILILILYSRRKYHNENQLKSVLAIYGIIAFLLELIKQLIWSFEYDFVLKKTVWDYTWYSFPFQLCTTPIFVSLICLFLKNNKLRKSLLSYMAYVTIIGSLLTIIMPQSCFVEDTIVNIHTMWLHCGSFIVSIYLFITKEVKIDKEYMKQGLIVFGIFALLAQLLNIGIYNSDILNGETFNMFYISPYFISTLPIFDIIQQNVPYILFLLIYIFAVILGATLVCYLGYIAKKIQLNKSKKGIK